MQYLMLLGASESRKWTGVQGDDPGPPGAAARWTSHFEMVDGTKAFWMHDLRRKQDFSSCGTPPAGPHLRIHTQCGHLGLVSQTAARCQPHSGLPPLSLHTSCGDSTSLRPHHFPPAHTLRRPGPAWELRGGRLL